MTFLIFLFSIAVMEFILPQGRKRMNTPLPEVTPKFVVKIPPVALPAMGTKDLLALAEAIHSEAPVSPEPEATGVQNGPEYNRVNARAE